jgi:hypothetical protein
VVDLPKDDADPLALRVACAWARTQAAVGSEGDCAIDPSLLRARVEDIRQAMERVTDAKKALGGATRHIEQAGRHVENLRADVIKALAGLLDDLDQCP